MNLDFKKHPLFPTGHLQTIASHFISVAKPIIPWKRVDVPLADGSMLVGRQYHFDPTNRKPVLLFFHGLGGCADSNYMSQGAAAAQELGWDAILFNLRNAGQGMGHALGIYHSGCWQDLSDVVKHLKTVDLERPLVLIGYSLSGNLILNSMSRGHTKADAAIAVNPALHLPTVSTEISRGLNRIYEIYFIKLLRQFVCQLQDRSLIDAKIKYPRTLSLLDFDNAVTAPLAGHASAMDYYEACSSFYHVQKIDRPTFILHANDDPFIPAKIFYDADWSSSTRVHVAPSGGHVGYLAKSSEAFGVGRWLKQALVANLRSLPMLR